MATTSEVKHGLDEIAKSIRSAQQRYDGAKANIEKAAADLGQIPSVYAGIIAEIDGYTPSGAFETLSQDEKGKLQVDFVALKARMDALIATAEYSA